MTSREKNAGSWEELETSLIHLLREATPCRWQAGRASVELISESVWPEIAGL